MPTLTPTRRSLLRADPTRTATLRRAFAAELARPFARLRLALRQLVLTDDAFGLTLNVSWALLSLSERIRAFGSWLGMQINTAFQGTRQVVEKYTGLAFRRGAERAHTDVTRLVSPPEEPAAAPLPGMTPREAFLRSLLARPDTQERLDLLITRTTSDLDAIAQDTRNRMVRAVTDGLVAGQTPKELALGLATLADRGSARAGVLARTEVIRTHAEAQLEAMSALGVPEVGALVEWITAGDDRVCIRCRDLAGEVMPIEKARGRIPLHNSCRCSWIPVTRKEPEKEPERPVEEVIVPVPKPALPPAAPVPPAVPPVMAADLKPESVREVIYALARERGEEVGSKRLDVRVADIRQFLPGTKAQQDEAILEATFRDPAYRDRLRTRALGIREEQTGQEITYTVGKRPSHIAGIEVLPDDPRLLAVPAQPPKERWKMSRAELLEQLGAPTAKELAAGKVREDRLFVMRQLMEERSTTVDQPVMFHGMTTPEKMRGIQIDGVFYLYSDKATEVERSIVNILDAPIPDKLRQSTRMVVFSSQANKDDALYAQKFNLPGFSSAATGGDGNVVVYKNKWLDGPWFGHESGHNFAKDSWGNITPAEWSRYGQAQKASGPVSAYGAVNPAEDFAEACRLWITPAGRQTLQDNFPAKYSALAEMFGTPPEPATDPKRGLPSPRTPGPAAKTPRAPKPRTTPAPKSRKKR